MARFKNKKPPKPPKAPKAPKAPKPAPQPFDDCDPNAPCLTLDSHRYCGSDGITYYSSCGKRNAMCKNPFLTFTSGSCPQGA